MIETYLIRLTLAGLRPQTLRVRGYVLRAFERENPDLARANRYEVEAFLGRQLAPISRRAYASHLRMFFRYLIEEGLRHDDPTDRLPRFRVPQGLPRPIATDDLAMALKAADPRTRTWLLLEALAGLRAIEVAGLRPENVLTTEIGHMLHLRVTKGGGERIVPAHDAIVQALTALPVRDGAWWDVGPRTVSRCVGDLLRSLGIAATGHQLRHWAATTFYETSGHDLLSTAAFLGHANVANSQIYTRVNPRRPAEVVAAIPVPGFAA